MERTVGFDFGTHQTKICVETKEGAEKSYEFFKFKDKDGKEHLTLPSVIFLDDDGLLSYGYRSESKKKSRRMTDFSQLSFLLTNKGRMGEIVRYFKQSTFTDVSNGMPANMAKNYSIWFISFVLFELQERYGQDFAIQMGVPSDGDRFDSQKQLAVSILLSSIYLVEDVFKNDKKKFLATPIGKLKELTKHIRYDEEKKEYYSLLVFPEAYACLMPLVKSGKIEKGMSLMVDIGGGTTDISFFTIEDNNPQVYKYYSINKGLNYLTDSDNLDPERENSNVSEDQIIDERIKIFSNEVLGECYKLLSSLYKEFEGCRLTSQRLNEALKNRPIVYSGGGSRFQKLREKNDSFYFNDVILVSEKQWDREFVIDMKLIEELGECPSPILSTAYGLSKGVASDDIELKSFSDIFRHIKEDESNRHSFVNDDHNSLLYSDFDTVK